MQDSFSERERVNLNIYTCLYRLKYASCWGYAEFKISQLTASLQNYINHISRPFSPLNFFTEKNCKKLHNSIFCTSRASICARDMCQPCNSSFNSQRTTPRGHLGHQLQAVTKTRGQITLFWRAETLHQDVSHQHWRDPREQHCPTIPLCLTINEVMMGDMYQVLPGHC